MDVAQHIREAHKHLSLAVAKFPQHNRTFYVPAWVHWYSLTVRAMLRVGNLADRMEHMSIRRKQPPLGAEDGGVDRG